MSVVSKNFGGERDGLVGRDFDLFAVEGFNYAYAAQASWATLVGV